MKLYCYGCQIEYRGSESFEIKMYDGCPFCGGKDVVEIAWETVKEYKKRTGKHFPQEGVVFWLQGGQWEVISYKWVRLAEKRGKVYPTVIADPPWPPEPLWRPA